MKDSAYLVRGHKQHQLLHKSGHNKPVLFEEGKHESYAAYQQYPIFLDVDSKTVRIAIDFIVMLPKVYVKESIPFQLTYPISEVFWQ